MPIILEGEGRERRRREEGRLCESADFVSHAGSAHRVHARKRLALNEMLFLIGPLVLYSIPQNASCLNLVDNLTLVTPLRYPANNGGMQVTPCRTHRRREAVVIYTLAACNMALLLA